MYLERHLLIFGNLAYAVIDDGDEDLPQRALDNEHVVCRQVHEVGDHTDIPTFTVFDGASGEKVGTAKGFHGDITATVTLNADGTIAAVALDTSSETAGIGSLVGENADFATQFVGKTGPFTLGAGIDVVAGASVTSEAAVLAVNSALK